MWSESCQIKYTVLVKLRFYNLQYMFLAQQRTLYQCSTLYKACLTLTLCYRLAGSNNSQVEVEGAVPQSFKTVMPFVFSTRQLSYRCPVAYLVYYVVWNWRYTGHVTSSKPMAGQYAGHVTWRWHPLDRQIDYGCCESEYLKTYILYVLAMIDIITANTYNIYHG
jgi:hypothetical protein